MMEVKEVGRDDGISQVELIGTLDVAGMHDVDAEFHSLTALPGQPCIVDLSKVTYIASLGMGMLISCAQSLGRRGQKMVLMAPQEPVLEVLRAVGLDSAIPIVMDEAEALREVATQ